MRTRPPLRDGDHQSADRVDVVALILAHAHLDRVALAAFAEAGDLVFAADHQPQRAGQVGDADAKVGGALPVHRDANFRVAEIDPRLDVDELRQRVQPLVQLDGIGAEPDRSGP